MYYKYYIRCCIYYILLLLLGSGWSCLIVNGLAIACKGYQVISALTLPDTLAFEARFVADA